MAIQDRNVYAINSVLTFHEHRSTNCGALIDTKPCCSLSKPLGSLLLPCKTQTTKSLPRQWSKVCRTYCLLAALGRAGESAATEAGGRLAVVDAVDCLGLVGDHLLQVLARSLDGDLRDRASERAISHGNVHGSRTRVACTCMCAWEDEGKLPTRAHILTTNFALSVKIRKQGVGPRLYVTEAKPRLSLNAGRKV